MNSISDSPSDYYDNGLVSPEDVRALARQLCLEQGESSMPDPQHWLEAEAWFRYRNSEGREPVCS